MSRMRATWRGGALLLAATLAFVASVAVPSTVALAGRGLVRSIFSCGDGQVHSVGSFNVSCAGQGAGQVTVVATGTSCGGPTQPAGRCDLGFEVALPSAGSTSGAPTIVGVGVPQSSPLRTSSGGYQQIVWTYALQSPGVSPQSFAITVTADQGVGMNEASSVIKDSKNISDGAAKGQASD